MSTYWLTCKLDAFFSFIGAVCLVVLGSIAVCAILLASAPLALVMGLLMLFGIRFNLEKLGTVMKASAEKAKATKPAGDDPIKEGSTRRGGVMPQATTPKPDVEIKGQGGYQPEGDGLDVDDPPGRGEVN